MKPSRVDVHLLRLREAPRPIFRIVSLAMPGSLVAGFEDVEGVSVARERAQRVRSIITATTQLPAVVVHGGPDWMLGDGSSLLDEPAPKKSAVGRAGGRRIDPIMNIAVAMKGGRDVAVRLVAVKGSYLVERERTGPFPGYVPIGSVTDQGDVHAGTGSTDDLKILKTMRVFLAERGAF